MAHTHTKLLYHVIYSTAHRRAVLTPESIGRLAGFTGGVVHERGGTLLILNGASDHVHLLVGLTHKLTLSDQVRDIKALTSRWLKSTTDGMRDFAWQEGYSVFSVSSSVQAAVTAYIARQEQHHQGRSFEQELVELLTKAGVDYDPRFVCD